MDRFKLACIDLGLISELDLTNLNSPLYGEDDAIFGASDATAFASNKSAVCPFGDVTSFCGVADFSNMLG